MPIQVERNEQDPQQFQVLYAGPWRGLDTKSAPMSIQDGLLPAIQNMDLPAGTPTRIDGHDLHAASFDTGTSVPSLLARYIPVTGSASYITADESGQVYSHATGGGAPTIIRRGLSTTSGVWWSDVQIGDYLVIANETDGNYKWDGTRLLPLGAKYAADMESDETTWTGGSTNTTDVREGTQSRSLTAAGGGTADMNLQPATARDLLSGLLEAADYNTTTDRMSFFVNLDTAVNLDLTTSYIRFGNAADTAYFQALASTWGTLANGWNLVRVARSSFTTTGAPNWNTIAKISFHIDANPAVSVVAIFDDVYVIYRATAVMPNVQMLAQWKNILFGAVNSDLNFSEVGAPDEYTDTALFPVDQNDGTEVTSLHAFYNQVMIGKDNSLHSLTGTVAGTVYPNFNFELLRITTEHGVSSHRAVIEAKGGLYLWWRGEIHRYNGTGTEKVSTQIDPTLATVNMARLRYIVGARRRVLNQIGWWYSDGSATTNASALVYDYAVDGFITRAGQAMVLAKTVFESDIEYLLTAEYDGEIMRQDFTADFDGTGIVAIVTYPWTAAGDPDKLKAWAEANIPYQTFTGNLTVQYRVANHPREFDAASFATAGTIDQAVTGELGRAFIGERGRWFQLRLTTTNAYWTQYDAIKVVGSYLDARF